MRILNLTLALLATVTITGCASGLGGGDYQRAEARRVINVRMGSSSVRPVKLEGTKSPVGTWAARRSAASRAAPSARAGLGHRRGHRCRGGRPGQLRRRRGHDPQAGHRVTLKMDNGELLAVTQEDGGEVPAGRARPPAAGRRHHPRHPLNPARRAWPRRGCGPFFAFMCR